MSFLQTRTVEEIITLGPAGTSSEQVAHYYMKNLAEKNINSTITKLTLEDSFMKVLEKVNCHKCICALVPHAYERINEFYINANLQCIDMFMHNTPVYGLARAKNAKFNEKNIIAANPVTFHMLDTLITNHPQIKNYQLMAVNSTSIAAELVEQGIVDLAITNKIAMERRNLEFVALYGPITMGWSVFVQKLKKEDC